MKDLVQEFLDVLARLHGRNSELGRVGRQFGRFPSGKAANQCVGYRPLKLERLFTESLECAAFSLRKPLRERKWPSIPSAAAPPLSLHRESGSLG